MLVAEEGIIFSVVAAAAVVVAVVNIFTLVAVAVAGVVDTETK